MLNNIYKFDKEVIRIKILIHSKTYNNKYISLTLEYKIKLFIFYNG